MARPARQRSSASTLALAYAGLIVYASLYPFGPWRWPPGQALWAMLALPWPPWRDPFDVVSNGLGYLPLGALLFVARVRAGQRGWLALVFAVMAPALLSYTMEVMQHFVPRRVPSRVDWALNCAGAAGGAVLAAGLHAAGLLRRWQATRDRWFFPDSAGGLALLALWPLGLLYPAPVPFGLGYAVHELQGALRVLIEDVGWAQGLARLIEDSAARPAVVLPLSEMLVQVLGLLAPCLLVLSLARRGWRRLLLVLSVFAVGAGATTLSTALSFGPSHALAWLTPLSVPALIVGALVALAGLLLDTRVAAGVGLVVLGALVVLVAQAPVDPYYAASLQGWEQGRFVRFSGLAWWLGGLWPYAAMVWLLRRAVGRGPG